ncbi:MAG: hypothetical protein ACI9RM_001422 [Ulvibacter sp.]|jgi:hypothetical protein
MNYSSSMLKTSHSLSWNPIGKTGYDIVVVSSIDEMPALWEQAAPEGNIFLGRNYLQALEHNPPENMNFCYILYRKKDKPIGVAACQIQRFNVDKGLNQKESEASPCFFTVIGRFLKGLVASKVEFTTFVCGNILLTGEHGYCFKPDLLSPKETFELVDKSMDVAKVVLNQKGANINGYLMKDLFQQTRDEAYVPANTKMNEFIIEPNMVLDMDPKWKSFDDYLASMHSKYRVRARKAIKSSLPLEKQSFDESQIEEYKKELYKLYQSVAEKSGFNLVNLNVNYLLALKKEFKDDFTLDAYFLDGELIAFYTTLLNGHELEAHFLGFNQDLNRKYQMYLNILYEIVKIGIEKGVEKVVFARTAMEIKSSVGARAHDMYCYMRHPNAFSNKFVAPILDYLKPNHEGWVPRQPFKDRERY